MSIVGSSSRQIMMATYLQKKHAIYVWAQLARAKVQVAMFGDDYRMKLSLWTIADLQADNARWYRDLLASQSVGPSFLYHTVSVLCLTLPFRLITLKNVWYEFALNLYPFWYGDNSLILRIYAQCPRMDPKGDRPIVKKTFYLALFESCCFRHVKEFSDFTRLFWLNHSGYLKLVNPLQ